MGDLANTMPIAGTAITSFNESWDMGFHAHPGIEMSVVLEGKGCFQWMGIETRIEKGNIILIQANVIHNYHALNSNIRFAVLDLQQMSPHFSGMFSELMANTEVQILRFSELHLEQYESLFRIWLRSLSEQTLENPALITTWANLFLLFIQQNGRANPELLSISAAEEYIRSKLDGELRMQELASLCGMSESSMRRAFHASFGTSPKQYQQECRMTEAKWKLRSTDNTIHQIAEQVGYASVHAFSAWFHQKAGLSPTEWRKQQIGHHT